MAQYTEVTLEIPVPRSLWPPKIQHVLLCDRNWTSALRRKENSQYFHAFLTPVLESMNGQPHARFRSYIQEFHIFKMTQTKNRAHLELQTRVSRERNSQSFVSDGSVNVVARRCCQTSLDWQMATPTTKELVCPSVGEERDSIAVQSAFQSQFDKGPNSRYPIYVGCKTFGQERCICEGKCPSVPSVSGATVHSVSAYCRSSSQKSMRLGVSVRHCVLNARCTAVTASSCAKCRAHQRVRCGVGCGSSHFQSQ